MIQTQRLKFLFHHLFDLLSHEFDKMRKNINVLLSVCGNAWCWHGNAWYFVQTWESDQERLVLLYSWTTVAPLQATTFLPSLRSKPKIFWFYLTAELQWHPSEQWPLYPVVGANPGYYSFTLQQSYCGSPLSNYLFTQSWEQILDL